MPRRRGVEGAAHYETLDDHDQPCSARRRGKREGSSLAAAMNPVGPTGQECAFARVAWAECARCDARSDTCWEEAGGPFARAHGRSPFRARCGRRDAARAGRDPVRKSPDHFFRPSITFTVLTRCECAHVALRSDAQNVALNRRPHVNVDVEYTCRYTSLHRSCAISAIARLSASLSSISCTNWSLSEYS